MMVAENGNEITRFDPGFDLEGPNRRIATKCHRFNDYDVLNSPGAGEDDVTIGGEFPAYSSSPAETHRPYEIV